ncbi:aldehyde dehydrogenase family protein [Bacillus velezensis]
MQQPTSVILKSCSSIRPTISVEEANRVESWVNEDFEKGADLLCDGKREGSFYYPTGFECIPHDCRLATK